MLRLYVTQVHKVTSHLTPSFAYTWLQVLVNMPAGKVLEHYGIKIEFVGACSMWAKHAAGKQMCKHRISEIF